MHDCATLSPRSAKRDFTSGRAPSPERRGPKNGSRKSKRARGVFPSARHPRSKPPAERCALTSFAQVSDERILVAVDVSRAPRPSGYAPARSRCCGVLKIENPTFFAIHTSLGGWFSIGCGTLVAPSQKEGHLARSLSAQHHWLRGPVTHSVVRWSLGWRWRC